MTPRFRCVPNLRRTACLLALFAPIAASWFPASAADRFTESERGHWSYQPVVRRGAPTVRQPELVRNPIDAFLLTRLEAVGLSLSPEADKRDLLRRVKFDLVGLPPTPAEVDEFAADTAPGAYERLVDRLLASPHYGEHWGRMWLDVVRYAETSGYNADPLRPNAWKFRDYVISAFNNDKPFDRFVEEQIAGDELYPDNPQAVIGSGYALMWPDESNASNILLARQDALNDLTGNVGSVFLGVSIGCAQCHDHKFDPLLQKDFFRLQAFFSGLVRRDEAAIGTNEQLLAFRRALDEWMTASAPVREELQGLEHDARMKLAAERRMKFPQVVLDAIDCAPEKRTTMQRQLAFFTERQIEIKESEILAKLSEDQKVARVEVLQRLADWNKRRPKPDVELAGMVAGEIESVPPPTFLLAGGSYDKPLYEVAPGYLSVLYGDGDSDAQVSAPHPYSSGRRSALAHWLSNPRNPLVPRVLVNRIWQGHFGRGLVDNGNDFGVQTAPPTHPELLDWLAAEFVSPDPALPNGSADESAPRAWSIKRLHRLIVTSTAYRQSADRRRSAVAQGDAGHPDPGNRLYWNFPRRRLPAESLRDTLLAVCGQLNPALLGPSVSPELPADFNKREAWTVSANPADRRRRSIYIHAKRNLPYPFLETFDLPDMHESCARRSQTTVAPQALMLLNSELVLDYARSFAGRVLRDNPHAEAEGVIREGYRLAFGREPEPRELAPAARFIEAEAALAESRRAAGEPILLPHPLPKFLDPAKGAAVVDFCHALLNASEFLYVD